MTAGDENEREQEISVTDKRRITIDGELRGDEADGHGSPETGEEAAIELLPQTIPIEELHAAEDRAAQAERRYANLVDDYKRYRDEHDAVRQRLERDVDARVRTRLAGTFAGLLGALDNLDRALDYADDGPLAEGVRLVRQQLLDALAEAGLERIELEGSPFDPELADAIEMVPVDDDQRHNVVLDEIRCGYRFKDQVLRPAQVKVGLKGPAS